MKQSNPINKFISSFDIEEFISFPEDKRTKNSSTPSIPELLKEETSSISKNIESAEKQKTEVSKINISTEGGQSSLSNALHEANLPNTSNHFLTQDDWMESVPLSPVPEILEDDVSSISKNIESAEKTTNSSQKSLKRKLSSNADKLLRTTEEDVSLISKNIESAEKQKTEVSKINISMAGGQTSLSNALHEANLPNTSNHFLTQDDWMESVPLSPVPELLEEETSSISKNINSTKKQKTEVSKINISTEGGQASLINALHKANLANISNADAQKKSIDLDFNINFQIYSNFRDEQEKLKQLKYDKLEQLKHDLKEEYNPIKEKHYSMKEKYNILLKRKNVGRNVIHISSLIETLLDYIEYNTPFPESSEMGNLDLNSLTKFAEEMKLYQMKELEKCENNKKAHKEIRNTIKEKCKHYAINELWSAGPNPLDDRMKVEGLRMLTVWFSMRQISKDLNIFYSAFRAFCIKSGISVALQGDDSRKIRNFLNGEIDKLIKSQDTKSANISR